MMPSGVFFRSALINLSFLQAPQLEPSHVWSTGPLQPSLWSVARHQGQDIETAERHTAPEAPSRWLGKMVWMAARWLELFLGSNENSNHANANVCFFSRGFVQKMNSDKVGDEMKTWSAHSYRPPYIFIQTLMMCVSGIKPCFHLCTPHTVLLLWPRRLLRLSSLHSERSAECHRSRHHPPAADFPVACVECGSFWSDLLTSHIHSTIIVNHISCPNPKYNSCDVPSSSDLWGQAIQQYSAIL